MTTMTLKVEDVADGARVRRVFSLVNHCIANIAAYRAGWIEEDGERKLRIDRNDELPRAYANFEGLDLYILICFVTSL